MSTREFVLFELVSIQTGTRSRVLFWSDYGVVMPNLATTNGSFLEAAILIYGWVGVFYTVENLAVPSLDFSSLEALRESMRKAYTEWSTKPVVTNV